MPQVTDEAAVKYAEYIEKLRALVTVHNEQVVDVARPAAEGDNSMGRFSTEKMKLVILEGEAECLAPA